MQEELKVLITAENSDYKKKMEEAEGKLSNFGKSASKFAMEATKFSLKATTAVATASATMVGVIAKASLNAYADYEQLVGGVDTLFKDSSGALQEYAQNAYKAQQMSANEYMEIATSFSASLLQSLGGDTAKAVDSANMAITDMADNANKMGSSMESIQNAYQGFAKQNYTMLDNLKLGYGGTKSEMERLLADAEKLTGIKYDINNLNDVFSAIHAIQLEMGITGTSAQEALGTIQGSTAMAKASWQNLLVAIANTGSNLLVAVSNLTESVQAVITNVGTRLLEIFPALVIGIRVFLNSILETVGEWGQKLAPMLVDTITALTEVVVSALTQLANTILTVVPNIIDGFVSIMGTLGEALNSLIDTILADLPNIVSSLATGIVSGAEIIFNAGVSLFRGICEAVPVVLEQLGQMLPELITSIGATLKQGANTILSSAISMLQGIVQALPTIITGVIDGILNLIIAISNILSSNVGILVEGATTLFNGIIDALPQIIASITEAMPQIIEGIVQALVSGINALVIGFVQLFMAFIQALPDIINIFVAQMPLLIMNIVQGLIAGIGVLVQGFVQLFMAFIQAIPQIISLVVAYIPYIINGIISALLTCIPALVIGFVQLFMAFIQAIPQIIVAITENIPQIIVAIIQGLIQGIGALFECAGKLGKAIWDGIKSIFTGKNPGDEIVSETATSISNGNDAVYQSGQAVSNAYCDGIASQNSLVYDTSYMMGDTATNGFTVGATPIVDSANNLNNQVVDEFANGRAGVAEQVSGMCYDTTGMYDALADDAYTATSTMGTNVVDGMNTVSTDIAEPLNAMSDTVNDTFTTIEEIANRMVNNVVSAVESMVSKLQDTVNFKWDLPHLKIPHLSVSGRFNTNPPSVPTYSISWYARGGVFDMPTLFNYGNGSIGGLGENGAEAVVPLENNTEWLDRIAERLGAGKSTPVILQVDGKVLAETTIDSVNTLTRQTGKLGLVLA